MYTLIQKENAQRFLMQSSPDTWRTMLPITNNLWIAMNAPVVNCTALWCVGTVICYLPKVAKTLCSFHTLPIVKDNYFLQPQIEGTHIDNSDITYKLIAYLLTEGQFVMAFFV